MNNIRYSEYFDCPEIGFGMYVIPCEGPLGIMFNFNDLCAMLDINIPKRKRLLKDIDDLYKMKCWFIRNNDPSEETFITTPEVSRLISNYGQEIQALINRKYIVENLVYSILNDFDKNDQCKMEDGYTLGDKFILNTLYCDSKLAKQSNDNLINLLRQNSTIESVIQHHTNINVRERFNEQKEIKELIEMCNSIEKVNDCLDKFLNGMNNEKTSNDPLDYVSFNQSYKDASLLIDDFEDDVNKM